MMLRHDNRRWDVRNELHISFRATRAAAATGFIGTAGCVGALLTLAAALALVSCDETKDVRPVADASSPRMSEPGDNTGTTGDRSRETRWTPGGAESSPAPQQNAPVDPANASRQGWAVVLDTFTTQDHRELAAKYVDIFRQISPFTDVWIESDERGSIVRYGSYPAMDSKIAQNDLTSLKQFVYNDVRPFAGAYLSRIASNPSGRLREYNLVQAYRLLPREDTVYSLQIGVYEAEQDTTAEEARRLAEQAVAQLRAQGEMAFYYHSPNRSMVCIGVFPSTAVDAATGFYSPEVTALQRRFPYNSFNGRSLKQEILTNSGQRREELQPSFLVLVPRE